MDKKSRGTTGQICIYVCFFLILIVAMSGAMLFGGTRMSVSEMAQGLFQGADSVEGIIIRNIRLPRMLAGLLAGAGLAVSGALLQAVTDNGMASPNIIGVNAGAGFVIILLLYAMPQAVYGLPIAAFCGAFFTTLLIVWVANRMGSSKVTIILAGMALTTILNAGISFISLLDSDVVATYNYFSVGGLAGVNMDELWMPAIFIGVSLVASLMLSPKIGILCLGDSMAASLGVPVKKLRMACLICASASAAAVVSFAGLLGFVGLIVPHMARPFSKGNMTHQLAYSTLIGASLVMVADTLGRALLAPTEIPVGIVMALVGAPFFLTLLLRRKYDA